MSPSRFLDHSRLATSPCHPDIRPQQYYKGWTGPRIFQTAVYWVGMFEVIEFGDRGNRVPAIETEEVLDFLHGFWRLQNDSPLFRVRNRDWPWLAFLHKAELSGRVVTIGEICGILNVSYPTARKIMAGFEDMGYIRSDRDSFDKRKSIVRLTELGLQEMEKFERQIAGALRNLVRRPTF